MLAVAVALAARAQDQEPTDEQLRQSAIQFARTFLAAPRVGKVWEGTQHVFDDQHQHVGYVYGVKDPSGLLQETWVTWDGDATLHALPGKSFTLRFEDDPETWYDIVDALPVGEHPVTGMEVQYRYLTENEVTELSDEYLPLVNKTLYQVKQVLLTADGTPSGYVSPDQDPVDGWLLRVYANHTWQDHWTFRDSFEQEKIDGLYPVTQVIAAPGLVPIGSDAEDYYAWAKQKGATTWAFVQHVADVPVIVE